MGIPIEPPPITTEPTKAGMGSLFAAEEGLLRPYVVEVMRAEWAYGKDIGQTEVLVEVAQKIGLGHKGLAEAVEDPARLKQLESYKAEADERGVIGVPTFVVGEEIFWGNDRIEFLEDHLREDLRLAKL